MIILKIGEGVHKVFDEVLVPAGLGDISLFTELGRFMLAPYGHLVTKAIHEKHIYKEYIGVDACAANLMRPAIYGSYHHITVLGKEDAPCDHTYDVVGSLCENCDKFAIDRQLPKIDMGDYLVIHDTGAHELLNGLQLQRTTSLSRDTARKQWRGKTHQKSRNSGRLLCNL